MKSKKILTSRLFSSLFLVLVVVFSFHIFPIPASLQVNGEDKNGKSQSTEQQIEPPTNNEPIVRTHTHLVTMTITVTDLDGRFVTGLQPEHFEIYDSNVLQKIEFFSDEDSPLSVGIIFDTSGSMRGRINHSLIALRKFLDSCNEQDEFFLVGFNNQAHVLSDFTNNEAEISDSLMMAEPKGQTALYDAVYLGVEKIRRGQNRKTLIIISDGQDNNSRHSYKELQRIVKEVNVQIYAIGITNVFSDNILDFEGQMNLNELARLTGGSAFFPTSDLAMREAIMKIGTELRYQYSIGYTPTLDIGDKRWHKLKVKIKAPKELPHLVARTKEGYFSGIPNAD